MKAKFILTVASLIAVATSSALASKRTAEFILSDPYTYDKKEVSLDVAMVQPVRWVSPLSDFAFFHAMTLDRSEGKSGGGILVAVPSSESASFAKKYGTNFEGRNKSKTLRGTFVSVRGKKGGRPGIWLIDTTGNLLGEIDKKKAEMPEEAFEPSLGKGPGPGPRGPARRQ